MKSALEVIEDRLSGSIQSQRLRPIAASVVSALCAHGYLESREAIAGDNDHLVAQQVTTGDPDTAQGA